MSERNFFAALKRRNLYKVAVAYAVVGWLVMRVAATVVPALHLPEAVTSTVVVLVILGFPLALIFASAFELTPEGLKRADEVGANESITGGRLGIMRATIPCIKATPSAELKLPTATNERNPRTGRNG